MCLRWGQLIVAVVVQNIEQNRVSVCTYILVKFYQGSWPQVTCNCIIPAIELVVHGVDTLSSRSYRLTVKEDEREKQQDSQTRKVETGGGMNGKGVFESRLALWWCCWLQWAFPFATKRQCFLIFPNIVLICCLCHCRNFVRISVYGNTVCVPTGVYSKGLSVNAGPEYCMSVSQPAVLLMTPELSWTSKVSFAFFLSIIYVPFLV